MWLEIWGVAPNRSLPIMVKGFFSYPSSKSLQLAPFRSHQLDHKNQLAMNPMDPLRGFQQKSRRTDQTLLGFVGETSHPSLRDLVLASVWVGAVFFSPKVSGTQNGGTEPYKAILGVGFPLHKPDPYSLYW